MTYRVAWDYDGKEMVVELSLEKQATIVKQTVVGNANVQKSIPKPPKKQPVDCGGCGAKGLKRLIVGGAKLLKAELGVDACDTDTIIDRKHICESCEHFDFGVCNECGCFCAAKVKLKTEKCPMGQW
jgi:hypothetical protein